MMSEPTDSEKIKLYKEGLENETQLHWKRNHFFLISSSILLVVLGLLKDETFQLLLGIMGTSVNCIWFGIQDRSSRYIGYWKKKIQGLDAKTSEFSIYPKKLGGIQMRYLAYSLPIPFIFIWLVVIWISLDPNLTLSDTSSIFTNSTSQ